MMSWLVGLVHFIYEALCNPVSLKFPLGAVNTSRVAMLQEKVSLNVIIWMSSGRKCKYNNRQPSTALLLHHYEFF